MFLKKNPKRDDNLFVYTVAACSAVLLFVALSNLHVFWTILGYFVNVISPVLGGIVFAYIMSPICELFERTIFKRIYSRGVARIASVTTTVVVVLCIIAVLLIALIPQLVDSIMTFASNLNGYMDRLGGLLGRTIHATDEIGLLDLSQIIESINNYFTSMITTIPEKLYGVVAVSFSFGVGIANILIAFILAVYFLLDADNLLGGLRKLAFALLPQDRYHAVAEFWGRCHKILIRYICFDMVDGFIVGILNFIIMTILGMPYAVLISVIVGVTNLAPTFGPIAGGVLGAVILLLAKPVDALAFVMITLVIQALDGYLIKPRLFGSSLGVPAVWILVTIIIGGNLFGVIGILLAIPFAAIMTYVYRDILEKKIEEKTLAREEALAKTGTETES